MTTFDSRTAKITFRALIVLVNVLCAGSSTIIYDVLVAFGDSNTDTGNVLKLTNGAWPIPPYYQGRFSDGPVWIDLLGLSNVSNYAFGGATSDNNLVVGYTAFSTAVPGVRQQILAFRNRTTSFDFDRTVFVVWIGANDYFRNITLAPARVIGSVMNGVQDLLDFGAKHVLIMNQPPFHRQPVAAAVNNTAFLSSVVSTHNTLLAQAIAAAQAAKPTVTLQLIDINAVITRILDNSTSFGITNTNMCWLTSSTGITVLYNNTDNAIFIDLYHFTTRVHRFIADEIRTQISSDGRTNLRLSIFLLLALPIFHL